MTQTPAGWYPDGHGSQRWWDGSQWTEHTLPAGAGEPSASVADNSSSDAPAETPADPHSEPTRVAGSSPLPAPGQPTGDQPAGPPPSSPPGSAPSSPPGSAPEGASPYNAPVAPGYGAPAAPAAPGGYPAQGGYPQQGGYPPPGGGYPGQGFGQGHPQGAYPGPQKKGVSGKVLGLIGGGVLALVIVVVLLVVLLGGGGSSNSPSGVAKDFFDKAKDSNCAAFDDVDTSAVPGGIDLKAQCEQNKDQIFSGNTCSGSSLDTSNEKVTGDTATVDVKITGGGSDCEESDTWSFTKVGGDWKLDPSSIGVDTPSTSAPDVPTPSGF